MRGIGVFNYMSPIYLLGEKKKYVNMSLKLQRVKLKIRQLDSIGRYRIFSNFYLYKYYLFLPMIYKY
ncbi:MAG: hypothetical protein AAF573_12845 [Bacteroidota bacterium]